MDPLIPTAIAAAAAFAAGRTGQRARLPAGVPRGPILLVYDDDPDWLDARWVNFVSVPKDQTVGIGELKARTRLSPLAPNERELFVPALVHVPVQRARKILYAEMESGGFYGRPTAPFDVFRRKGRGPWLQRDGQTLAGYLRDAVEPTGLVKATRVLTLGRRHGYQRGVQLQHVDFKSVGKTVHRWVGGAPACGAKLPGQQRPQPWIKPHLDQTPGRAPVWIPTVQMSITCKRCLKRS